MEHIFITNGSTQLVLIPENDVDRILMEKLLSEGPVTVEKIRNPVGIMGKNVQDGLIIRKNSSTSTE
jgi:hypothetical protein